jgi:drug/metabolite transporter (DMT)-like permease
MSAIDPAPATTKETRMSMLIPLILVSVCLAAVAQITLKAGMNQVTSSSGTATLSSASLRAIATTPTVWLGLVLFAFSAVAWLFVLSRVSLSFAYPFASLSYLIIVLADRFVFDEVVPPARWAGVALIMTGIVLVARGGT